jgi:predicted aldo/keto reductase-like oxidoreductase
MIKRILGRTGMAVSVIGFGGIPIQRLAFPEAEEILLSALDRGINFIDTARGYTDSEQKIGRVLKKRRDQVVIATKATARDQAGMTAELEQSLVNLNTDVIDLYQIHAVESDQQLDQVLGSGGAFQALDKAREQGKVRFIGVTGHVHQVLERAVKTGLFDTVQHPFNPLETDWLNDVIPAAKAQGLGTIGMKPIGGGALGYVPLALRFSLTQGMDLIIPGMDSLDQVRENASVGETLTPLNEEELALFEEERARLGPHFCRRCGYCMPCDNGLHIPYLLLLQAYYERYDLPDWSMDRLATFEKKYWDCAACGECTLRCPYNLPVADLMKRGAEQMRSQ